MKDDGRQDPQQVLVDAALARIRGGDASAWQELMPLVYSELHALARREMADQRVSHTLQATALVHEVFLKLCRGKGTDAARHAEFLGLAATAMRSILIDHARARQAAKRSGPGTRVPLDEVLEEAIERQWRESPIDLLVLDELLVRLEAVHATSARLIELRYFAGRTVEEAAAVLGLAPRTAERLWTTTKAWLKRELAR